MPPNPLLLRAVPASTHSKISRLFTYALVWSFLTSQGDSAVSAAHELARVFGTASAALEALQPLCSYLTLGASNASRYGREFVRLWPNLGPQLFSYAYVSTPLAVLLDWARRQYGGGTLPPFLREQTQWAGSGDGAWPVAALLAEFRFLPVTLALQQLMDQQLQQLPQQLQQFPQQQQQFPQQYSPPPQMHLPQHQQQQFSPTLYPRQLPQQHQQQHQQQQQQQHHFSGSPTLEVPQLAVVRSRQQCKTCGQASHNAATCPQRSVQRGALYFPFFCFHLFPSNPSSFFPTVVRRHGH